MQPTSEVPFSHLVLDSPDQLSATEPMEFQLLVMVPFSVMVVWLWDMVV